MKYIVKYNIYLRNRKLVGFNRVSIELYKHEWKFGRTRNAVGTARNSVSIELYKHDFYPISTRAFLGLFSN